MHFLQKKNDFNTDMQQMGLLVAGSERNSKFLRIRQLSDEYFTIFDLEIENIKKDQEYPYEEYKTQKEHIVEDGDAVVIPGGAKHNIINISKTEDLKFYTIYSPPNHPEGTIHKSKTEADAAEKHEHH